MDIYLDREQILQVSVTLPCPDSSDDCVNDEHGEVELRGRRQQPQTENDTPIDTYIHFGILSSGKLAIEFVLEQHSALIFWVERNVCRSLPWCIVAVTRR